MFNSDLLTMSLGILAIVFLVGSFILTRTFWLWYFKINERMSFFQDQVRILESIDEKLDVVINQKKDAD